MKPSCNGLAYDQFDYNTFSVCVDPFVNILYNCFYGCRDTQRDSALPGQCPPLDAQLDIDGAERFVNEAERWLYQEEWI